MSRLLGVVAAGVLAAGCVTVSEGKKSVSTIERVTVDPAGRYAWVVTEQVTEEAVKSTSGTGTERRVKLKHDLWICYPSATTGRARCFVAEWTRKPGPVPAPLGDAGTAGSAGTTGDDAAPAVAPNSSDGRAPTP